MIKQMAIGIAFWEKYGGNGMKEILSMKIIFLDIDGVLQPYDNEERFQHDL